MCCEICKRGIADGVNLHRHNEKGVPGIWRCDQCNFLPLAPEVEAIVDALNPAKRQTPRPEDLM